MSTTPEPTPVDPTPVDPIPVDPFAAGPVTGDSAPADPPETDLGVGDLPADVPVPDPAADDEPGTGAPASRPEPDLRPLYAVAGLTDVLVGAVRSTLADTSHWAAARMAELRTRQAELEKQAAELRERTDALPDQVRVLPEVTRSRVNEFQQQASTTYADLAGRGQRAVQGVAQRVDPVFDRLQEGVAAARRLVTGRVGTEPATGGTVTEVIVVTETVSPEVVDSDLTEDDEPVVTPAGVPDEALDAEEVLLSDGIDDEALEADETEEAGAETDPVDEDPTTGR